MIKPKLVAALALTVFMLLPTVAQAGYDGFECINNNTKEKVGCFCGSGECTDYCTSAKLSCSIGNQCTDSSNDCEGLLSLKQDYDKTMTDYKAKWASSSSATQSGTAASTFKGVNLINPIGGTNSNPTGITNIPTIVGRAISILTGVVGALALLMFVYGSFVLMTSQGVPDRVERGKKVMIQAVIGLAVIFTAYAVIKLIFSTIGVS